VTKATEPEAITITTEVALQAIADPTYVLPTTDAEEAARSIMARILEATDAAGVSAAAGGGTESWKDLLGVEFVLRGVRFAASTFGEGPTVYALVDAVDVEGAPRTLTTGSVTAMAQLAKLDQLKAYPTKYAWRLIESDKPTASGYYPRWLEEVSEGA
jgi:hypothetical protein